MRCQVDFLLPLKIQKKYTILDYAGNTLGQSI